MTILWFHFIICVIDASQLLPRAKAELQEEMAQSDAGPVTPTRHYIVSLLVYHTA